MSVPKHARSVCLLFTLVLVAGCGGGGGALPPPPAPAPVTTLGNLTARLAGTDPADFGSVVIEIRSDGQLIFSATVSPGIVAAVTAIIIQRVRLSGDVPVVADLLSGGAPFNNEGTAAGSVFASVGDATAMAAEPDEYSVLVQTNGTTPLAGGFSGAATHEWHARLLGSLETNVVDEDAAGACTFAVSTVGVIDYVLAMSTDPIGDVTDAHIHVGEADATGAIVVDLEVATATFDPAGGTITGSVPITQARLSQILAHPYGFYCNAHTAAAMDGLVRGQLDVGSVEMWSRLNGDEEVQNPIPSPNASGGATISFDTFATGVAILAVPVGQGNGLDDVTDAHIHEAAFGVSGNIVIPLMNGADLNLSPESGSAEGSIAYNQTLFTRILAGPANFYVNLHSNAAPLGFARGQLGAKPETFVADLRSENEVPQRPAGDTGTFRAVFSGIHECTYSLTVNSPPVGDVLDSHVHDGAAGATGTVLIDLLGTGENAIVDSTINGDANFTGRTLARLLASDLDFYCNVHTAAAPDGVVRGQLQRITDETPPTDLSYSESPACYLNNTAITNNTPSNSGGAITEYGIAPDLPSGLVLGTSTGVISGTPTTTSANTTYTVTGSNAHGRDGRAARPQGGRGAAEGPRVHDPRDLRRGGWRSRATCRPAPAGRSRAMRSRRPSATGSTSARRRA